MTFVTTGVAVVGVPVHVTVYEGATALNPATNPVTWTFDAGAGSVVVSSDATGYNFTFPIPSVTPGSSRTWAANAAAGVFTGTINFTVTATLEFTLP